ncbi:MAG: autotransporter outer membrane beta-barrel domain-containing protein [bacterium]
MRVILIFLLLLLLAPQGVYAASFNFNGQTTNISVPTGGNSAQSFASPYESQVTQAQCGSSPNFLTVSFTPDSTGDIDISAILNGKTYGFSGASLVCDNGFAVCSPGTNENCRYYKWSYSGGLSVLPVSMLGNLAGCYCINDSCPSAGQPLSSSPSETKPILLSLGGGIVGTLMSAGGFNVGGGTVSGNTVGYSGSLSNCSSTNQYMNGGSNLQGYYNPYSGSNLISSTAGNQGSAYSDLNGNYGVSENTLTDIENSSTGSSIGNNCQITNKPGVKQVINPANGFQYSNGGIGGYNGGTDNEFSYTASSQQIGFWVNDPSSNCSSWTCGPIYLSNGQFSGSAWCSGGCNMAGVNMDIEGNGNKLVGYGACSGSISLSSNDTLSGYISCPGGVSSIVGDGSSLVLNMTNGSVTGGTVNLSVSYTYEPTIASTDTCASYENNSNCKLQNKQVCSEGGEGCITTVSNYNYNGQIVPSLISTYDDSVFDQNNNTYFDYVFTGTGSAISAYPSSDYSDTSGQETLYTSSASYGGNGYFNINETYVCQTNSQFNFNAVKSNQTQVENSAVSSYNGGNNNGTVNYSYTGYNNGNNYSGSMPALSAASQTGYSCIVKIPVPNTKVSNAGGMTGTQVTPSVQTVYKEESIACKGDSGTETCPLQTGYILVQDCEPDTSTNSNSFIKATVKMMIMDKLSQDLICSGKSITTP